jgi:hypothetical protein
MTNAKERKADRQRLLEAGWELELRGGLIAWRRPNGRGSWYSQEVAMEILEALEEKEECRNYER